MEKRTPKQCCGIDAREKCADPMACIRKIYKEVWGSRRTCTSAPNPHYRDECTNPSECPNLPRMVLPVRLPQEEHDRLDREAERWQRENPELAAIQDPLYLLPPRKD